MSTILDHLYSDDTKSSALETKVNNLSQITIKNNIANQTMLQPNITTEPTQDNNVMRLKDVKYERIINHTSTINANTLASWESNLGLRDGVIHSFVIKLAVAGVDYTFEWKPYINIITYKNMGPTFIFSNADNNLNESAKVKIWVNNRRFNVFSNVALNNVVVYRKYEKL